MKIVLADRTYSTQINKLRVEAYQNATNSTITDFTFLLWTNQDDEAAVLCIQDATAGQMISSMRGSIIQTKEKLEALLDIKIHQNLAPPVLMFDKLTTDINYRRKGLSGVLRYIFIEACIQSNIQNILFTINDGASRIPHLKEIGFQFYEADLSHRQNSTFKNTSAVLIGVLPHKDFISAASIAKANLKQNLNTFTIDANAITTLHNYTRYGRKEVIEKIAAVK